MQIADHSQYGLALHTTTPQLGLAMINISSNEGRTHGDRQYSSQVLTLGRSLSSEVHTELQKFLSPHRWQDLAFLSVAKGPGGFTGTRIGVVTARTLAQQLDVPLYGISTLAAIAWQLGKTYVNRSIAVALPARRGQVFGAIYRVTQRGLETLAGDQLHTPESWQSTVEEQPDLLQIKPPQELGHTVDSVLELAYLQWQYNPVSPWTEVVPFYGQHPVYEHQPQSA